MIYKVKFDSKEFEDKIEYIENRLLKLALDPKDGHEKTVYEVFVKSMETVIDTTLKYHERLINDVELRRVDPDERVDDVQRNMKDAEFQVNRLLSILEIGLLMIDNTKFTLEEEVI